MKTKLLKLISFLSFVAVLASCSSKEKVQTPPDIFANTIDTTIKPGDDFFNYTFGNWIKNNPIPKSETSSGIFLDVQNEIYNRLLNICKNAESNPGNLESTQMIGALWATGMDSITIDKQGLTGLQEYLDRINHIQSKHEVINEIAELQTMGVPVLFSAWVGQDDKNSEKYALNIHQGGLGLPDREFYFATDGRSANLRKEYILHISNMFSLLGQNATTDKNVGKSLMDFETSLASSSRKIEDLRDPYKNYNKYSVAELTGKFKSIEWNSLLSGMKVNPDSIVIGQPKFLSKVDLLLKTETLQTWKDYLTWNLVSAYASELSHEFVNEDFHFYHEVLQGQKEQKPRWKRTLNNEESYIGDLLGQEYVKNYFPDETKQRYVKLVGEILVSFREHIEKLDWMTDSTKQKALLKLSKINKKVGYPEKWKDYSSLTFSRDSYLKNCIAGEKWLYNYEIQKLGKPVDRDEWFMTPQTYNAYYNPSNNEIVLPAACFMIPGLKDEDADDAIVYGYAGASTIGHELTHAFDDNGSQYDEKGNLKNWWTKKDREQFDKKVKVIVNQYNKYKILDSIQINGEATAGENIADLVGIIVALDAFKKTDQYKGGKLIGGKTPLQRYFMGYALGWKSVTTDETLLVRAKSDVHSPSFLRVNGPFSDVPEFYEAFNVHEGDAMWRPDSIRVKIW